VKIPGGPKLKLIKAKTVKEKGVMVCTPTYRGMPTKQTFQCTREAMRHMAGLGYNVMYSGDLEGANLSSNRINGVMNAKDSGAHWVMFIDSDMTFPPDGISRLIDHNVDIVGGLYVKVKPPHFPTLYQKNEEEGGYNTFWDYELGELAECDATGAGFLLIKTEVFENMGTPYFAFPPLEKSDRPLGEDMYFCAKAKELGYKILVDTSLVIGHLGEHAYSIFDFLAIKEAEAKEAAGAEDKSGIKQAEG